MSIVASHSREEIPPPPPGPPPPLVHPESHTGLAADTHKDVETPKLHAPANLEGNACPMLEGFGICDAPSTKTRIGRALGLTSHVKCEAITKVVAKLTSHNTAIPPPQLFKAAIMMSSSECNSNAITVPDRNILFASELGKRLHTCCFEQGLKALFIIHQFIGKGHPSFRECISADSSLLKLDKAGETQWVMIPKARPFTTYIKQYGSYLNDLVNFIAISKPYDLFSKNPEDPHNLHNAWKNCKDEETFMGIIQASIALLKAGYTLTPDENLVNHPVSREMVKLVYFDVRTLYTFVTRSISKKMSSRKGKRRVAHLEKALSLFDQYETACAETSVFFATLASFGITTSTPDLKPVPRAAVEKMKKILENAKASNIEVLDFDEIDEKKMEKDTLENVLTQASEIEEQKSLTTNRTSSSNAISEDTAADLLSPQGSMTSANTPSTRKHEGDRSVYNFEEDSLADLKTSVLDGVQGASINQEELEDETDDIKELLMSANSPAVMVAAARNSASANRRFHLMKDDVLGKGGFGTVYKAWDKHEGMYAAVKEIQVQKEANVNELFSEFRTATSVEHPNIVRTLMFSLTNTTGSIFMEWLPAGSLHQVLAQTKAPFDERLVRRYIKDALLGLNYLHKRGIVHRDIKLSNMLLSSGGKVKLTDFGTSKVLDIINTSMKTETIVGTVPYLAPEAVRGTYSASSDIWAIGCSIIEMLTAKHPWSERNEHDQIAMIFHIGSLQAPNHIPNYPHSSVSDELRSFIEMCFVFDYHQRPSAEKLLEHPFLLMMEEEGDETNESQ